MWKILQESVRLGLASAPRFGNMSFLAGTLLASVAAASLTIGPSANAGPTSTGVDPFGPFGRSAHAAPPPTLVEPSGAATTFKVIHTFEGKDGSQPVDDTLVIGASGLLYGTTELGGNLKCSLNPGGGCGTTFEMNSKGREKVLHRFNKLSSGLEPLSPLVQDSSGNWYGVTFFGGDASCAGGDVGCGTVYKIDAAGNETVLHRFKDTNGDGAFPYAPLVIGSDGDLYGATNSGGASNFGTVFKLDPNTGTETVLHSFQGPPDGTAPQSGLVEDGSGNLYGTTIGGGKLESDCATGGCGTVYKIDTAGNETVLYAFTGETNGDGLSPIAYPVLDSSGNLYGTTDQGGGNANDCCGTVYEVSPAGTETVLYRFQGADGSGPYTPVFRGAGGILYGTTINGGNYGYGVVFKLATSGKEKVLHHFTGNSDGGNPYAGLTADAAGNLYGSAAVGGDIKCSAGNGVGCGVVFKVSP